MVVKLLWRSDLLDAALVQHDDAVGEFHRLVLVVRDEDRGEAGLFVNFAQPAAQILRTRASSAPKGSSSSSTRGSMASARASATRWRWPPESCAG